MRELAGWMCDVLDALGKENEEQVIAETKEKVLAICKTSSSLSEMIYFLSLIICLAAINIAAYFYGKLYDLYCWLNWWHWWW